MRVDGSGPVAPASEPHQEPDAGPPVTRPPAPPARTRLDPGAVLARVTVLPAVLAAGWLAAAYPLMRLGWATPVPAVLLAAAVVGGLLLLLRGLPPIRSTPWWAVAATVAVPVGLIVLNLLRHGEPAIVRRDQGVYALIAYWLAGHGGTGDLGLAPPGGADALLSPVSPGFYLHDGALVPQFMSGTFTALLPGGWVAGFGGIVSLAAVYAGVAVLAVAGLVARLVGPRWAPVAALLLGLCQPELLTARTTLSEPLTQLLMFGALCLLVDSLGPRGDPDRPPGGRGPAALAGLLLSLGLLVRIDALRDLVLVIPVAGWLAARHRPQWKWLAGGLAVGLAYGAADALGPSSEYVAALRYVIVLALLAMPVVVAGTALAVWWLRQWSLPAPVRQWVPVAAGVGTLAVGALAGLRPWLRTEYEPPNPIIDYLASLQREQGLPVDPQRSYAERSLHWVSWYVGWGTIAIAVVAAAFGSWLVLRRLDDRWVLALTMPLASTALVLYHPGITPDHPWADRRLVPTVLPTVALLAVAGLAAGSRLLSGLLVRRPARWPGGGTALDGTAVGGTAVGAAGLVRQAGRPVVVLAGLAVLFVPTVQASLPLLGLRTESGELAAIQAACAAFGPDDVALAIDARTRQELVPALRLICEVTTYAVPGQPSDATATPSQVAVAAERIRSTGRRPILVAQSATPLPDLTRSPQRQIAGLVTTEHERLLTSRPSKLVPLRLEIWIAPAS